MKLSTVRGGESTRRRETRRSEPSISAPCSVPLWDPRDPVVMRLIAESCLRVQEAKGTGHEASLVAAQQSLNELLANVDFGPVRQ